MFVGWVLGMLMFIAVSKQRLLTGARLGEAEAVRAG